jgi:hypothetical protein
MHVGDDHMVVLIPHESADELNLEVGRQVMALVNATNVMVPLVRGNDEARRAVLYGKLFAVLFPR